MLTQSRVFKLHLTPSSFADTICSYHTGKGASVQNVYCVHSLLLEHSARAAQEKEQRPSFASAPAGAGLGSGPASGLGFASAGPANQQGAAAGEEEEESVLPTAFGARYA
jgi:hypothetical protein